MTQSLPQSVAYLVIGAGMHGLSTAWHLARDLKARHTGSGKDILVIDKATPGAGATGIACGCIRNFYMTEPLHAILRHSVDCWMEDPVNFGFQQVGYISCGEANQREEYERIYRNQNAVGYESRLYEGADAHRFLRGIWPDFQTRDIAVALHELPSGYAGTRQAVWGLTQKLQQNDVRIANGVAVTGYQMEAGSVTHVETSHGAIKADCVILTAGAWVGEHWDWLNKNTTMTCHYADGAVVEKPMWTYWRLKEGEVYVDRPYRTLDGRDPPVLHVELMNTPVRDDSGNDVGDHVYVYWKNGAERMDAAGIQGGVLPIQIGPEAQLEPYGHANDQYQAEADFADYFCAAMGQLMTRFKGCRGQFRKRRNGGIGAFTPDNVPIFDWIGPNVYMIADSNHGFKMMGVGKLVAQHLASGTAITELEPFALRRFQAGRTFGDSNSNSPWV